MDQSLQRLKPSGEPVMGLLIHIEFAVEFDLQAVATLLRAAKVTDNVGALIGLVEQNRESTAGKIITNSL